MMVQLQTSEMTGDLPVAARHRRGRRERPKIKRCPARLDNAKAVRSKDQRCEEEDQAPASEQFRKRLPFQSAVIREFPVNHKNGDPLGSDEGSQDLARLGQCRPKQKSR